MRPLLFPVFVFFSRSQVSAVRYLLTFIENTTAGRASVWRWSAVKRWVWKRCELWMKMQQQKAAKQTEKQQREIFFSRAKIRACGGGRYGRADMIQRGQRDVRCFLKKWTFNDPLGIQSDRQQRTRRDAAALIRRGRSNSQVSCSWRHGVSGHLICFLWPFSTPSASPTRSSGQEIS